LLLDHGGPAARGAQWKKGFHLKAYIRATPDLRSQRFIACLCRLSFRWSSPECKIDHLEGFLVNNCPNCKKVIAELKMSTIKAKLKTLPAFDCVTLCCSFCGVILLAVPDLDRTGAGIEAPLSVNH
jgi:hypothetical protein